MERQDHERIVQLNDLFDRLETVGHCLTVVEMAAINPGFDIGESLSVALHEVSKNVRTVQEELGKMVEEMGGEATVELKAG